MFLWLLTLAAAEHVGWEKKRSCLCNVLCITVTANQQDREAQQSQLWTLWFKVPGAVLSQPRFISPVSQVEELSTVKHPHFLRADVKLFLLQKCGFFCTQLTPRGDCLIDCLFYVCLFLGQTIFMHGLTVKGRSKPGNESVHLQAK